MPVYSKLKHDYENIFVFKMWCHFVSNLQIYDTISAHVPKHVLQFALEKLQYQGEALI